MALALNKPNQFKRNIMEKKNAVSNIEQGLKAIPYKAVAYTATYHPSQKLSKLDEPDMRHCWRSKDELISDILPWASPHGRAKVGRSARTYIHQLCVDTGCNLEDLPGAVDDRDRWREEGQENPC